MAQSSTPFDRFAGLGTRIASASLLIPIVILAVYAGGLWFQILLLVLGCAMAFEWVAMCHSGNKMQLALHILAMLTALFCPQFIGLGYSAIAVMVIWIIAMLAEKSGTFWSRIGVLYISLPIGAFALIRADAQWGFAAVIWLFVMVWSADTLAYISGRMLGGPKLAPKISPNKTWAGLAGAVCGAVLASAGLWWFATPAPFAILAVLAVFMALIEQGGDFFESAVKRHAGVKDSGSLIPGHGGVLDRVDGLLAVVFLAGLIGVFRAGKDLAASGLIVW